MIPLLDLKAQHEPLYEELRQAFERVLKSGRFILGEELEAFENELSSYLGIKYAKGVGNCTDGLTLSLRALKIGPGSGVITTPFTFVSTAEVVSNVYAHPFFVDIDPETFNLDPKKLSQFIEEECDFDTQLIHKKTKYPIKGIIIVHLFGQSADMDEILQIAVRYNLKVIEDAAQSLGASYKGKKVGGFGDLGAFSFYPSKNLSCLGDGGIVVTNDERLAHKIGLLRIHGQRKKYDYAFLGYNSRLDALQAAFLRVKLKRLDEWNEKRRRNAELYNELLKDIVTIPVVRDYNQHIYNQYTIRVRDRDRLRDYLKEKEIGCQIHYPIPLHLQTAFKYLGYKKGDFPEAEHASEEVISLPVYPELTYEQLKFIADSIRAFYT